MLKICLHGNIVHVLWDKNLHVCKFKNRYVHIGGYVQDSSNSNP